MIKNGDDSYPYLQMNNMENVQLKLDEKGFGHFYIMEGDEPLREMEVSLTTEMINKLKILR